MGLLVKQRNNFRGWELLRNYEKESVTIKVWSPVHAYINIT